MQIQVPEMLKCPPKLYPVITEFNKYLYFLLEGGRGSGKTQVIARFILYIGEKRKIKVCCGREIQKSIENSVKSVFFTEKRSFPRSRSHSRSYSPLCFRKNC